MKDYRDEILGFWFTQTPPALWFQVNEAFDAEIRERFTPAYDFARLGGCDHWQSDPEGCLALCVLFHQFPRNMFRGSARAYESDRQAIVVAKLSIAKGFDQVLPIPKRRFVYLPFEHSENLQDQKKAVALFEKTKGDDPLSYDYALKHMRVIDKFGRFPHRNALLGRTSTPEEVDFLRANPRGY